MPREGRIVVQNRYAPYLRALGTGVGVAVNNYRPLRDISQALRRSYDDYRSRKPRSEPPAKRQAVRMPSNAGATNVIQRAVVKQRSGKRVKRKSVNYLFRLQKAITSSAILRWQRMTEYDTSGAFTLGYQRETTGNKFLYPVFIFDITSCHMTAPETSSVSRRLEATPAYRLISSGNEFAWEQRNGLGPDGTAGVNWVTEASRGVNAATNAPTFGANAMLAWSDIRLALYGATNQTTRFTVSFIQFVDECYHPRAAREDPAVPTSLTADVNDQQGRFDAAMEELVKPLVFHPLHSAGNAQNVYRVLESRSFSVQPDTNTNEAKASPNVCYKLFKRMNRICKWMWQTSDKKATTTTTENKIDPDLGMDNAPSYNQFFGGTKKPYVHPNARIYMMITAQAYTRTDTSAEPAPIPISAINTPHFDILVRNKWLYDSS